MAQSTLKKIKDAIVFLSLNPGAGHVHEDFTDEPVKFWPVFSYLILYNPTARPIEIARVILGAQAGDRCGTARSCDLIGAVSGRTRRAEVAGMKVKDLHTNMGYPSLRYIRKGGKQHSLSLHPQTAQRLQEYLQKSGHGEDLEGPLFRAVRTNWKDADARRHLDPDRIDQIVRKYTKQALGIARGFSAHSCRATFATSALSNGCPLEDVQKALGHADSRTTKLYDKRGDNPERSATFFANFQGI